MSRLRLNEKQLRQAASFAKEIGIRVKVVPAKGEITFEPCESPKTSPDSIFDEWMEKQR